MLQSRPPIVYVQPRNGFLHGPLTIILALWAIAYPALLILFAAFGPIGALVGVAAAILLLVPWLLGLVVLAALRHFA
jgi:hypothetical protein